MALSEREQQVLRDLEEQLHVDDPDLARSMRKVEHPQIARLSPRHVGAGIALVLVGLVVVIAGVSVGHGIWSILVGVAGFALAVWGVTLILTRVDAPGGAKKTRRGEKKPSRFMERQAERWDRRRDSERG